MRGDLKGLKDEAKGLSSIKGPDAGGLSRYGDAARRSATALRELKREQAALGRGTGPSNRPSLLASTSRAALALGGVGAGAYGVRQGIGATVGESISFEKAMAQVRKKVDAPDEAGFRRLESTITKVAIEYGLAREKVAELTAEAGAAGIAYQDLERFMRLSAKAAVAWDMSAPEASQKLAEIKAGTQMTISELETLGEKINGLGDNSAAKERDIVEMFGRSGAAAKAAGVNFDVTLAALTAVRSTGLQPEIAARWFSAFTGGLRTIEDGSKKSKEGLALLGLDAAKVARGMKTDALGTMLDIFDKLQKSPEAASAAIKIFGKEWWDETSRAAQALPELKKQLEYLKSGKWEGSLNKTLGIELATTANHLERLKALASDIGDRLGRWALPGINDAVDGMIKKFDELQERLTNKPASKVTEAAKKAAPLLFPPLILPTLSQDPRSKPVKDFLRRQYERVEALVFGEKLTKDPARPWGDKLGGAAADAEALSKKQTEEAAILRVQAANAKKKQDRARLAIEAGKKEKEAQSNAELAERARRGQGQAAARDMTNIEGGQQAVPAAIEKRLAIRAEISRLEAVLAAAGDMKGAAGKLLNPEAIRAQIEKLKTELGEVPAKAKETGDAVKTNLTMDLSSEGGRAATSFASGLAAGTPAAVAAAQSFAAQVKAAMTPAVSLSPAARPATGDRPVTGGGAAGPRSNNVQVAAINITGVSDPDRAAKKAVSELAGALRGTLSGAHHDGVA